MYFKDISLSLILMVSDDSLYTFFCQKILFRQFPDCGTKLIFRIHLPVSNHQILFCVRSGTPGFMTFRLSRNINRLSVYILLNQLQNFFWQNVLCPNIAHSCPPNIYFFRIRNGYNNQLFILSAIAITMLFQYIVSYAFPPYCFIGYIVSNEMC